MPDPQEPQSTQEGPDTRPPPPPAPEPISQPDEIAPPVASLIASIRAALTPRASGETRAAGATACRSILAVLEAKPGQPLAPTPPPTSPPSPAAPVASPLATLLSQPGLLSRLAAMSRDELIDLLKHITSAMPAQPSPPTTAALRFHLIPVPGARRPPGA